MAASVAWQPSDQDPVYFNQPGVALVTWNPDLRAVCLESQGWADAGESHAALDAVIPRPEGAPRLAMPGRQSQEGNQAG